MHHGGVITPWWCQVGLPEDLAGAREYLKKWAGVYKAMLDGHHMITIIVVVVVAKIHLMCDGVCRQCT